MRVGLILMVLSLSFFVPQTRGQDVSDCEFLQKQREVDRQRVEAVFTFLASGFVQGIHYLAEALANESGVLTDISAATIDMERPSYRVGDLSLRMTAYCDLYPKASLEEAVVCSHRELTFSQHDGAYIIDEGRCSP